MNPLRIAILLLVAGCWIGACGPETIFLRPGLDTPAQHVKNGHNLLSRGKFDAADSEFARAKTLDPAYVPAHVGIALVQAHRGDVDGAFETLRRAEALAITPDEREALKLGYARLTEMQSQ